jgi:hypothetical protein
MFVVKKLQYLREYLGKQQRGEPPCELRESTKAWNSGTSSFMTVYEGLSLGSNVLRAERLSY